jgi:hypothetical protein
MLGHRLLYTIKLALNFAEEVAAWGEAFLVLLGDWLANKQIAKEESGSLVECP